MFGIVPALLKERNEMSKKKKKKNGWGSGRPKMKDRKQENTKGLREKSEKDTIIVRGDFPLSHF